MSQVLNFKEVTPQQTTAEAFLVFSNPGVLDINLVKLLGVSVKDSDNAIGFFGTGLKYALASTLRLGGEITIFSDGQRYDVGGEKLTLRDKEFTRVTINGEALGFTTDLGKQWDAWMVVRELYHVKEHTSKVVAEHVASETTAEYTSHASECDSHRYLGVGEKGDQVEDLPATGVTSSRRRCRRVRFFQ